MTETVFQCANARCRARLNADHVTLVTTGHVRRFCTVECIHEGQQAHHDAIAAEVMAEEQGMTGTDRRAAEAVLAAHQAGLDIAEWVAGVLARAAATLGSTEALLANRPGSWEAGHLRALLAGTVGEDDEYLPAYRAEEDAR